MRYIRVPVEVVVSCKADGEQVPKEIVWHDGRRFCIQSCRPRKKMRCEKTLGPDAFRYECVVMGRRKLLYRSDEGGYFVEAILPKDPDERLALESLAALSDAEKKGRTVASRI